jgi:hypothetical protein
MKKYEVTIRNKRRSPCGSATSVTKIEALARNGIDAACHVLHLLGDLEGGSFSVFVKPALGVQK